MRAGSGPIARQSESQAASPAGSGAPGTSRAASVRAASSSTGAAVCSASRTQNEVQSARAAASHGNRRSVSAATSSSATDAGRPSLSRSPPRHAARWAPWNLPSASWASATARSGSSSITGTRASPSRARFHAAMGPWLPYAYRPWASIEEKLAAGSKASMNAQGP